MKRFYIFLILVCVVLASVMAVSAQEQVTVPCGFRPNVQFAPFYVGMEKGFFAEEGFDVELDYSLEIDTVALVGAGRLPFGICSGEQVLLGRNQGLPIQYVVNWYKDYPVGILSKAEKNIQSMEDLRGLTVGIPELHGASYIGMEALLQSAGMQDSDMNIEVQGYTQSEMLVTDRIDAAVVYVNNEPVQLKEMGYETNLMLASEYYSMIGNGLITNEETIEKEPEKVQRMVNALVRSIQYTIENPDEAYEICKIYVDGLAEADNPELQKQVLLASIALFGDVETVGISNPEAWTNMEVLLKDMGMIDESVSGAEAFTNRFVTEGE